MTTETTTVGRPAAGALRRGRGYGALWVSAPRELLFLILTMPIAITAAIVLSAVFFVGIGLLFLVVGIFIVVGAMFAARGFGTLELVRLEWAGRPPVRRPEWEEREREAGFWRQLFAPFVDGHYWLYLLHGLVVNPVISLISWIVTITWLSGSLGGLSYWFWGRFSNGRGELWLHDVVIDWLLPGNTLDVDPFVGESVLMLVVGVVFAITLPWVFRGLTLMHEGVARGLLTSWRFEQLERRVAELTESRGAAVRAEDVSLRRLERDIHDGPQQRLVRLQMDLAAAERRLGDDPDAARELLAEARAQTADALEELRALSRGFAPPILQDRGLAVALASLAARSPVPVIVEDGVGVGAELPAAIERNAYFIAAELLTNAAKHSGASAVRLTTATRADPAGSHWLDVWVGDNGRGGAAPVAGHGLAGLGERVLGLGGVLVVDSPIGGPTMIGAHLPYTAVVSA